MIFDYQSKSSMPCQIGPSLIAGSIAWQNTLADGRPFRISECPDCFGNLGRIPLITHHMMNMVRILEEIKADAGNLPRRDYGTDGYALQFSPGRGA